MSIENAIRYLVTRPEVLPAWAPIIRRECLAHPARIPLTGLFDRDHFSAPIRVPVAGAGKVHDVFRFLLRDAYYSAPTFNHGPVYTGKIETLWPLDDLIVRLVDPARLTILNVTLPRHIFFPGLVKLSVGGDLHGTWVDVMGRGQGSWAALNERFGPKLFQSIVSKIPKAMAGR